MQRPRADVSDSDYVYYSDAEDEEERKYYPYTYVPNPKFKWKKNSMWPYYTMAARSAQANDIVKAELGRLRARYKGELGRFRASDNGVATKTMGLILLRKGGKSVLFSGITKLRHAVTGPGLLGDSYSLSTPNSMQLSRYETYYIFGSPNNAEVLVAVPTWGISEGWTMGEPNMKFLDCVCFEEIPRGSGRIDGRLDLERLIKMMPEKEAIALTKRIKNKVKVGDSERRRSQMNVKSS